MIKMNKYIEFIVSLSETGVQRYIDEEIQQNAIPKGGVEELKEIIRKI